MPPKTEQDSTKDKITSTAEKSTADNALEYKSFNFVISETKENLYNGNIKTIKGYASTYGNVDRSNDIVFEGAFDDSIEGYKQRNRPIKVYYQHNTYDMPIGGIKPENILSDKNGLFVSMDINTKVQRGSEVYELSKQGVLSDMSIGFSVEEYDYTKDGIRCLKKLAWWETSIVGEPANIQAKITEVKNIRKHKFYNVTDLKDILITKKDYENVLRESGAFSKEAATFLAAHFVEKARRESEALADIKQDNLTSHFDELKNLLNKL